MPLLLMPLLLLLLFFFWGVVVVVAVAAVVIHVVTPVAEATSYAIAVFVAVLPMFWTSSIYATYRRHGRCCQRTHSLLSIIAKIHVKSW